MIILGVSFCGTRFPIITSPSDNVGLLGKMAEERMKNGDCKKESLLCGINSLKRSPSLTDCLEKECLLDEPNGVLLGTTVSVAKKNPSDVCASKMSDTVMDCTGELNNTEQMDESEMRHFIDPPSFVNGDYSANESYLDESDVINSFMQSSSDEAEARLWAKRQARAEAREIRMRELERIQREQEENADRQFDMMVASTEPAWVPRSVRPAATTRHRPASRRNSEDSVEDGGGGGSNSLRDLRAELKEVEERFRKAMIANAQLDNDKAAHTYQLELFKDRLEELEEENSQLKREHRDKCREHEQLKRLCQQLKEELQAYKYELEERDRLIAEKGLVIVCGDPEREGEPPKKALVHAENARLLEGCDGSLDVRLANFAKERGELQDQISSLKLELEEERSRRRKSGSSNPFNGPLSDYDPDDLQREASKQLADYKFRAQKAEQDVATLQATVARLESQVIRYKTAAEVSEQSEEALKAEKRKLQREAREAQNRADELETSNTHLLKRLDKLKNAKSALLKEL